MTVDELHQMQMQRLTESFGIANALSAARDDRAARALGNHYAEASDSQ